MSNKIVVTGTRGIPHIQGGVETHCEKLYPRLASFGYDITLLRRKCYVTKNNIRNEYKGVMLKDLYAPHTKCFEAITHTFLSILYAKRIKAGILHIHAIGPALLTPFAKLLGLRVIFTHHGADYKRSKWGRAARQVLRLGEKMGIRYADRIIVISESIRDEIFEKYGERTNVDVIHNGVEKPVLITGDCYIHSLGLQSRKYIFTLGRFVEEKGFHNLIEAYSKSRYKNEIKLVIAGDADHVTPYSKRLKDMAEQNDIVLTGFVQGENLSELFSHARMFVLPSFHEGLSISLLEAMSYGLPVIASNIEANRYIIEDEDMMFDPFDTNSMVKKIEELSNGKFELKKYDLTSFDWDVIASKTAKVISVTGKQ